MTDTKALSAIPEMIPDAWRRASIAVNEVCSVYDPVTFNALLPTIGHAYRDGALAVVELLREPSEARDKLIEQCSISACAADEARGLSSWEEHPEDIRECYRSYGRITFNVLADYLDKGGVE